MFERAGGTWPQALVYAAALDHQSRERAGNSEHSHVCNWQCSKYYTQICYAQTHTQKVIYNTWWEFSSSKSTWPLQCHRKQSSATPVSIKTSLAQWLTTPGGKQKAITWSWILSGKQSTTVIICVQRNWSETRASTQKKCFRWGGKPRGEIKRDQLIRSGKARAEMRCKCCLQKYQAGRWQCWRMYIGCKSGEKD